jgi:CRISPR-associated protein Csy1
MPDARLVEIQSRLKAGDAAGARSLAASALADGALPVQDRFAALVLRARASEALGDLPNAIPDLEGALALDGRQPRIWNELGLMCADAGLNDRAIAAFQRSVHGDPAYARSWNNLGNALRFAGRVDEAILAVERAVAANPGYALGWSNLGTLKRDVGDDAAAEAALSRALALEPENHRAMATMAGILRARWDAASAARLLQRVVERDPRDAQSMLQLAGALAECGDPDGARAAFARTAERDPHMLRALFGQWLTLPMVPADSAEVVSARAAYADGLAQVARIAPERAVAMSAEHLLDELRWTNFLLAYQGGDDLPLQVAYARIVAGLVEARAPEWLRPAKAPARAERRIRIGFVSTFFRDGTVGRYFEHWITELPRADFDVHVYHLAPGTDALVERIGARADAFRRCPWWQPSRIAAQVRADGLDVLVYPELGMGAIPFALAALRLAPLQCAAWGHPVTTGHATIDVYFSSAAMEPADGASHYAEKLVTLPGIGTRYAAPAVPADATRERFGLPEADVLLLCPQSLFKIHPDNDALFARVLAAIPRALLVCFEGRDPRLTARYLARLAAAGIATERVRVLPQYAHDDFLRINAVCDVMLDTLHWSGGNTSLDALACGLPIVTLPGRFMRGRQSAGMLALMGVEELVARDADDYVRIVAALADDGERRAGLAQRIRDARARIFDDPAPVAALARWLRENAGTG